MSMDKKQAARKAAAKYSTDAMAAAVEYGKLTEQSAPSFNYSKSNNEPRNTFDKLKKEMLELLPQYRHPTKDWIMEDMIFFGHPNGPPGGDARGHIEPEFLGKMKKEGTPTDTLKAVKKYVEEAEQIKIELNECKDELKDYKEAIEGALGIYNEFHSTPAKKNAAVVQYLGLSTGYAPKQLNEKKMYKDYFYLVRKRGMGRYEAVDKISKKHNAAFNTVIRILIEYRHQVKKKWEQEAPKNLPTVEKWLKGFVLPAR